MKRKNDNFIRLPDSELKVMQVIWDMRSNNSEVDAGSMMSAYPDVLGHLKLTTVLTLITRLNEKGFLSSEKRGRTNYYTPLVSQEDYNKLAAADFIRSVYNNSPLGLISALVDMNAVSREEIDELRKQIFDSENKN